VIAVFTAVVHTLPTGPCPLGAVATARLDGGAEG
jgi:hypothetical protein